MTSVEEFNSWLHKPEDCNLEFKGARNQFSRKDLLDYCAALANEGGGKLILGVHDKQRRVTGTNAFSGTHSTLPNDLLNILGIRVDVEELFHPDGRVLVFHVPRNHPGIPVESDGRYLMRAGESLTSMDAVTLRKLLTQIEEDFSAKPVPGLDMSGLDETAVAGFAARWAGNKGRKEYTMYSPEEVLRSVGILTDAGICYAGLILFGKPEQITRLLPGSEIIFEWRQEPGKTAHDYRKTWRAPFFLVHDEIWEAINVRNLRLPFQAGLFQREIAAFNEKTIREALLNAVTHRDYSIGNRSVFIKASPEAFEIESPGGFPPGITPENILFSTAWRNRRIAETFEKAGLVERAGQGMDDIFKNTIKEGKGSPDLSQSDAWAVRLRIPARIRDAEFILFLEKVGGEKGITFSSGEILDLEAMREHGLTPAKALSRRLLDLGIVERVGRTRGTKYILSRRYFSTTGKTGVHTRLAGIPREKRKELILEHLKRHGAGTMREFLDIFPEMKAKDITNLLQELKMEKQVVFLGSHGHGIWKVS